MILQIRNMKSDRCIALVANELEKIGISCKSVQLGEVEIKGNISRSNLKIFDIKLKNAGLELMIEKKRYIVEKIKSAIYELIFLSDDIPKLKFSDYISKKLGRDYNYLSNLFSGIQGTTIEKYIITQKIKRVKELLVYDNLSLSDIAFKMQYSSVAHLSVQFKKFTGLKPSSFRQLRGTRRPRSQNV